MSELLTVQEHVLIAQLGHCAVLFEQVIGDGAPRNQDLNEVINIVHQLQTRVMAQAAARAYPDQYRLLGRLLPQDREVQMPQADPVTAQEIAEDLAKEFEPFRQMQRGPLS